MNLETLRASLIDEIAGAASDLLLDPELLSKRGQVPALRALLRGWEAFAQGISTSNPGYWSRDLRLESARHYKVAQHAIRSLETLTGDKSS